MWIVMSSDGQMSKAEMLQELKTFNMCPLIVYDKDGQTTVPLFSSQSHALAFAKQNTHRTWTIATTELDADIEEKMQKDGLTTEVLTWPNRRDTSIHVLYLDQDADIQTHSYGNRSTVMKGL